MTGDHLVRTLLPFLVLIAQPLAALQPEKNLMPTAEPRRIVLCLDGTWNSTYDLKHRSDGTAVLKPSNVLKLCRAVKPRDSSEREQIVYYDIGIGSLAEYPGTSNRLLQLSDKYFGGVWGAGFEGNIEDALSFLVLNYQPGDEVFIFGFSRGAATARGLTRFLDWSGGIPAKRDAYYLPQLFRAYIVARGARQCPPGAPPGCKTVEDVLAEINEQKAGDEDDKESKLQLHPISIQFLGVWDTVMALGSRFRAVGTSTSPVSRSFHMDRQPAICVKHARQALAIDEARYDFRPEIWTGHAPGTLLEQRWFAGVHSNIGGGYVDDGLANLAFRWVLKGAQGHGLEIDQDFIRFYKPFPQDRLYRSENLLYRTLDALRGRFGRGRRRLLDPELPQEANLSLAASVIHRIQADPKERTKEGKLRFPELDGRPYRPENVLVFLAAQPDLKAYLAGIEDLKEKDRWLPQDVCQRIAVLRKRPAQENTDCVQQGATPAAPSQAQHPGP